MGGQRVLREGMPTLRDTLRARCELQGGTQRMGGQSKMTAREGFVRGEHAWQMTCKGEGKISKAKMVLPAEASKSKGGEVLGPIP